MDSDLTRRSVLATVGGSIVASSSWSSASAQEAPDPPDDPLDQGNETTSTPEQSTTYLAQVGPNFRIVDYEIEGVSDDEGTATIVVEVEADLPTLVSMSDVFGGVGQSGVSAIEVKQTRVPSGRSSLSMDVSVLRTSDRDAAALSLSVSGGHAVTISTGVDTGVDLGVVSMPVALAGASVTGVVGTALAAWRSKRDDLDEPERVEHDHDDGIL